MLKAEINFPEIKIVGLKVRTKNLDEMDINSAKIAPMVTKYFSENLASKIQKTINPHINYIIYCDYESDHKGYYTCIIGQEVETIENIPTNFVSHIIPAQKYIKFTNELGNMPEIICKTWQEIWNNDELDKNRNYHSDFEIYNMNEEPSENGQIRANICVGVK